jgi:hypothetical protein
MEGGRGGKQPSEQVDKGRRVGNSSKGELCRRHWSHCTARARTEATAQQGRAYGRYGRRAQQGRAYGRNGRRATNYANRTRNRK